MQYKLEVYKDGSLVNSMRSTDEKDCYLEIAKCYRDLTKHGYAKKGKLIDKMVDGVHVDIFDLLYESTVGEYRYHYEFDFSIRR